MQKYILQEQNNSRKLFLKNLKDRHNKNSYVFFPFDFFHIPPCALAESPQAQPGLWPHFRGYIPRLPPCPHPPSRHLATICLLWTALVAARAHLSVPSGQAAAQRRQHVAAGARNRNPFLNSLFLTAILKGEETLPFPVIDSQK